MLTFPVGSANRMPSNTIGPFFQRSRSRLALAAALNVHLLRLDDCLTNAARPAHGTSPKYCSVLSPC